MTTDEQLDALLRQRFGDAYRDRRDECRVYFAGVHGSMALRPHGPARVQTAVLHHTAGTVRDSSANVWPLHRDRLGWKRPGYGLHVGRDGRVEYWVGPSHITNGVWGMNNITFHIMTPGWFERGRDTAAPAQLDAIYRAFLCVDDAWGGAGLRWRGHNEASLPGHGTACPGTLLPHLKEMRGVRYGAASLVGKARPEHYG